MYNARTTSNLLQHPCVKKVTKELVKVEAKDKKTFSYSCTGWAVLNLVPFTITSSKEFEDVGQHLVNIGAKYGKKVDRGDLMPCRTTISNNVIALYNHFFPKIKEETKNIAVGAVTFVMWSGQFKRLAYLSVTVHYWLNETLIDRTIAVKHMNYERQTGENFWKN